MPFDTCSDLGVREQLFTDQVVVQFLHYCALHRPKRIAGGACLYGRCPAELWIGLSGRLVTALIFLRPASTEVTDYRAGSISYGFRQWTLRSTRVRGLDLFPD